jgi:hypothetical protein
VNESQNETWNITINIIYIKNWNRHCVSTKEKERKKIKITNHTCDVCDLDGRAIDPAPWYVLDAFEEMVRELWMRTLAVSWIAIELLIVRSPVADELGEQSLMTKMKLLQQLWGITQRACCHLYLHKCAYVCASSRHDLVDHSDSGSGSGCDC